MKFFLAVPSKSDSWMDSEELARDFYKRSGSTLLTPRGLLISTMISLFSPALSSGGAALFFWRRGDGFKVIAWTSDAFRKPWPTGSSIALIFGLRLCERWLPRIGAKGYLGESKMLLWPITSFELSLSMRDFESFLGGERTTGGRLS